MNGKSMLLAALVGIVAITAGVLLARSLQPAQTAAAVAVTQQATVITPPQPLPPPVFIDHHGQPFGAEQLAGRWSVLFFGFTNCPDICPLTLALLAQVEKRLADLPQQLRPQIILVSADPQRDTPQRLATYVGSFSPDFIGLTGDEATIHDFALKMHVPVAIVPLEGDAYTVDHSAAVFLVDPEVRLHAMSSAPHTVDVLARDYRAIVGAP